MYTGAIEQIDWDQIWNQKMELTSFKGEGVQFWDRMAERMGGGTVGDSYAKEMLRRMKLSPKCSVLDVGCGTGAMAIPIAERVARVTALDWSPEMLLVLRRRLSESSITNIEIVKGDWPKLQIGREVEPPDIVLASRSLPMGNLKQSLVQMNLAARQLCYLTWTIGRREMEADICRILGEEYHPFPDYTIIYNMLYSMGICANVEIFQAAGEHRFTDLDEAVKGSVRGRDMDLIKTKKIRDYLEKALTYHEGQYCQNTTSKWALIWWRK